MKRLISVIAILMFCLSLACPVLAAEDDFVPSISVKDEPDIVPGVTEDGEPYIGRIINDEDEVEGYVHDHCLIVTPISKAETSSEIPQDAKELLLDVYDKLVEGTMELPYEKFPGNLDPDKMVIRELVDITWNCDDHPVMVDEEGVYLELTFDLGVGEDTEIYVMTYVDGQWNPIVKTVNNGDGTVTCWFEEICPVAFSVAAGSSTNPPDMGDHANLTLWVALLAISTVALVAVLVLRRRVAR